MNVFLTVYSTPTWQSFINASGLSATNSLPASTKKACALLPPQAMFGLSMLLEQPQNIQQIWIATVQAEHFIAEAIDKGQSISDAAHDWEQLTNDLLRLHSRHRKTIRLFNLHQALTQPAAFREHLGTIEIHEYTEQIFDCSFVLLAASQYLTQQQGLQSLNTLLQASSLPLCESERLTLDIKAIMQQNDLNTSELSSARNQLDQIFAQLHKAQQELEFKESTHGKQLAEASEEHGLIITQLHQIQEKKLTEVSKERDLILAQLHQVQEELEKYFHALQSEKKTNKNTLEECKKKHTAEITNLNHRLGSINVLTTENARLKQSLQVAEKQHEDMLLAHEKRHKHTLLAYEKQSSKEITSLESELRKTKARAASAEFAGHLLQQELNVLKESILWKATTPVRMIGRLVKKTDEERETLLQQIGLLLTSEYFDLDWYLRTYIDVAESKMNPAEHYLLFGAKEGRLPGPLFDGNWYLQHYPDVAAASMNPLLHFIMYGQQEGRTSSPKLLTNTQAVEN